MLKTVVAIWCLAVAGSIFAEGTNSYLMIGANPPVEDQMMREIATFLEVNEYFDIASYDGTAARVRPVKFTCVMNNKVVVVTTAKRGLFRQMRDNPNVEFTRFANDKSAYIRYLGKAVECQDKALIEAFLAVHSWPREKFKEDLALFFIEPEMAGIFSMQGKPAKTKVFKK